MKFNLLCCSGKHVHYQKQATKLIPTTKTLITKCCYHLFQFPPNFIAQKLTQVWTLSQYTKKFTCSPFQITGQFLTRQKRKTLPPQLLPHALHTVRLHLEMSFCSPLGPVSEIARKDLVPKSCVVQRCIPLFIPQVDSGVCLQQNLDHIQIPLIGGDLQGSSALILAVDLQEGQRHSKQLAQLGKDLAPSSGLSRMKATSCRTVVCSEMLRRICVLPPLLYVHQLQG